MDIVFFFKGTFAKDGDDGTTRKRFRKRFCKNQGGLFPGFPLIMVSHADIICCAFTQN
jgi:hypothetical protein